MTNKVMNQDNTEFDSMFLNLGKMAMTFYEAADHTNAVRAQSNLIKYALELRKAQPFDMSLYSAKEIKNMIASIESQVRVQEKRKRR